MDNTIPEMPKDWWPNQGVVVQAKHNEFELGFAITKFNYEDKQIEAMMLPCLDALREALYQAQFTPKEELDRYYGLREENGHANKGYGQWHTHIRPTLTRQKVPSSTE